MENYLYFKIVRNTVNESSAKIFLTQVAAVDCSFFLMK